MRTLIRVTFSDMAATNKGFVDGSLQETIESAIERLKPEATYFYTVDGARSVSMICDLRDSFEVVGISESFFMSFNAKVELFPVMNLEDLQKGMQAFQRLQTENS